MGFSKIGFHSSSTGSMTGIGDYWRQLSNAGIPISHKAADGYGPLHEIVTAVPNPHNVEHNLVFRLTTHGQQDGFDYDVPDYTKSPEDAAATHWQRTRAKLPPEFNKQKVWVEPINEVDKGRADWLGRFAVAVANLAQNDGYKVTLFGWSSGEPEPEHWQAPGMLDYLRLCSQRPNQAAVSIHEYDFGLAGFDAVYPYHYGRFQWLFHACDTNNIPRPTVHITEWGWAEHTAPTWAEAVPTIDKANGLYNKYPQIKGAAIWNLSGNINPMVQAMIAPLTAYSLQKTFTTGTNTEPLDPDYFPPTTPPPTKHKAVVVVAHKDVTLTRWKEIAAYAYIDFRRTMTQSGDDAYTMLAAGNSESVAKIYQPTHPKQQEIIARLEGAGIQWQELVLSQPPPPPPGHAVDLTHYFKTVPSGNGVFFVLQHSDGRTEDVQHQVEGDIVYVVKNSQWEQLRVSNGYIWRRIDTSPGSGQYYKLYDAGLDWSKWCPSLWEIGRLYERRPFVRFYRKSDCQPVGSEQQSITYLKFAAHHANWTSPSGMTLPNVAELHWLLTAAGQPVEKYWYAKGIGMVQWQNNQGAHSYISEMPQGRPPLAREVIGCL